MARRKLSKQQKARVQRERQDHWVKGQIVARYGKTVELQFSEINDQAGPLPNQQSDLLKTSGNALVAVQIPGKFQGNTPIEDLAVGDWVYFDPATNLIESCEHRASALIRIRRSANLVGKATYKKDDQLLAHGKIVAANVTQLCVVVAPVPFIERFTIDEYLLAAQIQSIGPCIIANKNDRAEAHTAEYQQYLKDYEQLGFRVIRTSAEQKHGDLELKEHLRHHTSVFMGTSGVGKSSLLNMLVGDNLAATGSISETAALGKHTTTTARLYELPSGGQLIDSPGIREFKVAYATPQQLFNAYQDLYANQHCQYNNCSHREEPACAVKRALESGHALRWRYENYLTLYQSLVEGA